MLTEEQSLLWEWRIPFVIGALFFRKILYETKAFEVQKKDDESETISELLKYPKAILIVAGLTLEEILAFYPNGAFFF